MSAPQFIRGGWLLYLACLLGPLAACQAQEPGWDEKPGVDPTKGPYASVASCMPEGQACPGNACPQNAQGAPDGKTVDMSQCETLQLTFTTGTLVPRSNEADLAIYTGSVAGLTRVEVSGDGTKFRVAGFLNGLPEGSPSQCQAQAEGAQAQDAQVQDAQAQDAQAQDAQAQAQAGKLLVSLGRCGYATDVYFVRLTRDTNVSGAITVDAIEALSFRANN